MKFDILTIFPGFFTGFLDNGILRRALAEGRIEIAVHDLRAFTHDRHRTVDDRPFGGGEGMVLKPQPIARQLASLDRVVLICGRYEGVDERINQLYCDMELSIGDYILSGGELAAAVVIDATMRLLPGVLGNEASSEFESFGVADAEITTDAEGVPRSQHGAGGLLDYPHYTRPAEFQGLQVPETLLNGDHRQIRRWRREQQLRKTLANRPDLLENAILSKEDRQTLEAIARERTKPDS